MLLACLLARPLAAQSLPGARDRFFVTTDGVRLHYIEAGRPTAHTIVLVPGWTMPAWIWSAQIADFARFYHVVAFDPRGQGESDAPPDGYTYQRRGQDIGELIAHLGGEPVVLVGWSLGVLDALAYVHMNLDPRLLALILVDNSIGEPPAPSGRQHLRPLRPLPHDLYMAQFVRSMFRMPQPPAYLDRLTEAALHTPIEASRALLAYDVPRSYWREAVLSTDKPVLYVVRPNFAAQGESLLRDRPDAEMAVFSGAGHALFVDQPARFDRVVLDFVARRVSP